MFNCWNEIPPKEGKYLRLIKMLNGDVDLAVVDDDGDVHTYVLCLKVDGSISMYGGVEKDLGFQLDRNNTVKINKDTK